jgi:hypothetical protein
MIRLAPPTPFSPIGFQGKTCGGGNTQNCRNTTSLKYRITVDHFRAAALWRFGGYGENNASNGAYQFGIGADIPMRGKDVLSVDAICSHVKDSVALALAPGSNNAFGMPIPPFLAADFYSDDLRQYGRDVRSQVHDRATQGVGRLRVHSICRTQ